MISIYYLIVPTILCLICLYYLFFHATKKRIIHHEHLARRGNGTNYLSVYWVRYHYLLKPSEIYLHIDSGNRWKEQIIKCPNLFDDPTQLKFKKWG